MLLVINKKYQKAVNLFPISYNKETNKEIEVIKEMKNICFRARLCVLRE